jgi:BRCT domain type II-containing protein
VVGSDPGSKLAKALKLGIKVLNETEFLRILEQSAAGSRSGAQGQDS